MIGNKGLTKVEIVIILFMVVIVGFGLFMLLRPQALSKNLGRTTTITLEPGVKLEEITWKDESLWYLTRPMRDDEMAETHTFQQSSNMGIIEGTVIVIEQNVGGTEND